MFSLFILSLLGTVYGTRIGLNAGAQFDTSSVGKVVASGASVVRLNFIVTSSQSGTSDPAFQVCELGPGYYHPSLHWREDS
jgi:hypothetical protein